MDSINTTFGIGRLIAKHLTNALDADEQQQLDAWLKADEKHTAIFNRIVVHESLAAALIEMQQINTELALANVKIRTGQQLEAKPAHKTAKLWPRIAAAIAIVFCIGIGYSIYLGRTNEGFRLARNYKNDIAPGKNTAILVVNGKQTQLSDAKEGIVVNNDIKYNDGTQVGSSALGMTDGDSRALEVITPKGGTYFIILQDGTKVWLNADSKLEVLPNFWNKTQRLVKLTGEAYFEVAKILSPAGRDGRRPERVPFLVESQGQLVEVLGTHFNISAYAGEVIKTTLLEGSVRIEGKLMLKPGQQSEISLNRRVNVKQVDAAEVTAWKDGKFVFNSDDMNGLMRQVARWYNVEVVYQDNVQDVKLTGSVSRFANISTLLDKLGQTGSVKFKLDGRTVTVMKAK